MSRVAKKLIETSKDLVVDHSADSLKVTKGNQSLSMVINSSVALVKEDDGFWFKPKSDSDSWAMAGTMRALANNMVEGLTKGFKKELELVGVGYRAKLEGRNLTLTLGYSHPIEYMVPDAIDCVIDKQVNITLSSIDKRLLGQVTADIIKFRKPDAYKGKGVRLKGGKPLKLKEVKKK